jgi:hypothetical protein
MNTVAEYFEARNYSIRYCHKENLGWDLEATLGKQTLLLEVKGLSGSFNVAELTHNEYTGAKANKKHYRICIVPNALSTTKSVPDIYFYDGAKWINKENHVLKILELTAARLYNSD